MLSFHYYLIKLSLKESKNYKMRIFKLLSFKLFVLVFIILTLLSFFISYYLLQSESERYTQMITEFGLRVSEIIRSSTRHSMLYDRKEDTYNIIRTIAKETVIEKVRIYNKNGSIIFSADEDEINQTVDMQNEACYMCHKKGGDFIIEPTTNERRRIFKKADGTRLLGFVTPINNETSCYTSTCHYHKKSDTILGTLDIIMSLGKTDEILLEERKKMISTSIAVTLFLALTVGVLIWFFVHVPVRKITLATKEISSGNLDYRINFYTKDEIGLLASSFNKMTKDLKEAKNEITEWSNKLEKRVEEKTEELKKTQERILQIEKMASLGQLSATVAHELNNPMAGILTYSKLIQKKLKKDNVFIPDKEPIMKHLKMIETESERCGLIIKDLLVFSKKQKAEFRPHQINSIIETSLQLIDHHLNLNNIELKRNLASNLPQIQVDENQIKQMLLALYVNAVEAMDHGGILTVSTNFLPGEKSININIQDNGKGISDEVKAHIFEPFFTTKHETKGFGLGLAVVYGIVQNHQGEILVESKLHKGTVFTIKLPIDQNRLNES